MSRARAAAAAAARLIVETAVAGTGLVRVLSYQVASLVSEGKLRVVLAQHEPPPAPIHVVHHEGRRTTARVRALVDLVTERLRNDRSLKTFRRSS